MSQTSFVGSSRDVNDRALTDIALVMFVEFLQLVWDELNKDFLPESTSPRNLFTSVFNLFIFMATLFLSVSYISSDISISHIAAIKSVHLLVAVNGLWCFCL